MPTLYRQYRPQTFAEIIGQPSVVKTLEQAVQKDRIAHAYLFHGPRGTGKTTTARVLAKRLNCLKPKNAEPCGKCTLCKATQSNQNIDIIEIDAASNRGIDDIRALREAVYLRPSMGKYKVYIIDEVHMLTHEAFSALLKTLEEPVPHVIFILATTEFHKVPATILSRCQVYRFRRATDEEMRQRLTYLLKQEKRTSDDEAIDFIIARSDGCYRDAESLLGQLMTLQERTMTRSDLIEFLGLPPLELLEQFLSALVETDTTKAVEVAEKVHRQGFDPEQFLQECIREARDAAIALAKQSSDLPAFAVHPHAAARLPQIIRTLLQAVQDLAYVPEPRLAVELAILTVCRTTASVTSNWKPATRKLVDQKTRQQVNTRVAEAKQRMPAKAPSTPAILQKIQAAWSEVIQHLKEKNPVASTFLRATQPVEYNDGKLTIQAQYSLHRNFFEKPANKSLVEETIGNLTGLPIQARFQVSEPTSTFRKPIQRDQQPEEELYQAVKEVFG